MNNTCCADNAGIARRRRDDLPRRCGVHRLRTYTDRVGRQAEGGAAESSVTNSDAEKRLDARGIGEVWANVIKLGERRRYEKFRAHEEGDGEDVPGGA